MWWACRRILRAPGQAGAFAVLAVLHLGVVGVVGGGGAGVRLGGLVEGPAQHRRSLPGQLPGRALAVGGGHGDAPARRTGRPGGRRRTGPPRPERQVIASAVTGPTPYSRAARTLAPVRCRAASSSWCRTACSRASSASITSRAVATCSCPAGDRCAAAAARSSATPCSVRSAPSPSGGAPWWNSTAQLRLGGALAAQVVVQPPAAPGTPGCGRAGSSTPVSGLRPAASAGAGRRSCRSWRAVSSRAVPRCRLALPDAP